MTAVQESILRILEELFENKKDLTFSEIVFKSNIKESLSDADSLDNLIDLEATLLNS